MTVQDIEDIRQQIARHESNLHFTELGHLPLFAASPSARLVIVGQAPGIQAQLSGKPWSDASGARLVEWLGITEDVFRDTAHIAHVPMDFYYPGKGKTGDLPPRKDFAQLWHPKILKAMPQVETVVLIGRYAQGYYLRARAKRTLTETVRSYADYLPTYFPLVHPSPLNFRWFAKNPWFEAEVVPALRKHVDTILKN